MKYFLAIEFDRSVSMDIYVLLKKFLFYYPGFDPVSGLQYSLSTRLDTFPSDRSLGFAWDDKGEESKKNNYCSCEVTWS